MNSNTHTPMGPADPMLGLVASIICEYRTDWSKGSGDIAREVLTALHTPTALIDAIDAVTDSFEATGSDKRGLVQWTVSPDAMKRLVKARHEATTNPRIVTLRLANVDATRVPFDDIEGFALAAEYDSPYSLTGEIQVWTPTGIVAAKPGEWIVYIGKIGPRGEERATHVVVPDDVFRAEFTPLDDTARALFGEASNA